MNPIAQVLGYYVPPVPTMLLRKPSRSLARILGEESGEEILTVRCSCNPDRILGHSSEIKRRKKIYRKHYRTVHAPKNAPQRGGERVTTN